MLYFQGFEGILGWDSGDFDGVKSGEMLDFSGFCRTHYRTQKWQSTCGWKRYALSGNRTLVLKCKPRPLPGVKIYYNSTVLWYVFG